MKMLGQSHIGLMRRINQDNFLIEEKDGIQFMMVCDGMGGANAGEVASLIAIQSMHKLFLSADFTQSTHESLKSWLKDAFIKMNRSIYDEAQLNDDYSGMGTTAVGFMVYKDSILCANVGDSRAYVLDKNNKLVQITEDHSLINELIKSKRITLEQAKTHPQRSVLTNVCGVMEKVVVDVFKVENDVKGLLCCSDGLHNMLSDKRIESILKQRKSIEHKVEQLINESNQAGGYDNITVTLAWKVN
ncbi:MAG: Stp1/IreP family PP2C-type Ser/Thr phosphatase [Erysipelotrichaceae bacterium]|nr:Stp1/IreP family PP2C-type Ser/Thr phosphatase [Erysipelotrichaceae bacterium]